MGASAMCSHDSTAWSGPVVAWHDMDPDPIAKQRCLASASWCELRINTRSHHGKVQKQCQEGRAIAQGCDSFIIPVQPPYHLFPFGVALRAFRLPACCA